MTRKRPGMRPRFELRFEGSVDELRESLRRALETSTTCEGKVFRSSAAAWLPEDRRSYWSPYLNLSFESPEETDAAINVRARFSPHPSVWTLFIATYFALGLVGLGFGVYGMIDYNLGGSGLWLLGVPGAAFAIAFVFGASLIGQGLSADEMYDLRRLAEEACAPSSSTN